MQNQDLALKRRAPDCGACGRVDLRRAKRASLERVSGAATCAVIACDKQARLGAANRAQAALSSCAAFGLGPRLAPSFSSAAAAVEQGAAMSHRKASPCMLLAGCAACGWLSSATAPLGTSRALGSREGPKPCSVHDAQPHGAVSAAGA